MRIRLTVPWDQSSKRQIPGGTFSYRQNGRCNGNDVSVIVNIEDNIRLRSPRSKQRRKPFGAKLPRNPATDKAESSQDNNSFHPTDQLAGDIFSAPDS